MLLHANSAEEQSDQKVRKCVEDTEQDAVLLFKKGSFR